MEEILDAQRPGCPPEYFNMKVPICHPLFDPDCQGDAEIPFLRTRYDFGTGYNPNNPRQQVRIQNLTPQKNCCRNYLLIVNKINFTCCL